MKKFLRLLISTTIGVIVGYIGIYWISEIWLGNLLVSQYSNVPEPWQPAFIGVLIWFFLAVLFGFLCHKILRRFFA